MLAENPSGDGGRDFSIMRLRGDSAVEYAESDQAMNEHLLPRPLGDDGRHVYSGWMPAARKDKRRWGGHDSHILAGFGTDGVPVAPATCMTMRGRLLIPDGQVTRS